MHGEIDELLGKRRITPTRRTGSRPWSAGPTDHAAFADGDFVIEAVFEELAVKKQVFAEVEKHVAPTPACWPPTPPRCR